MTRNLSDTQRRDWLRLARTENVGASTFGQLISRFGEASVALGALPDLAMRGGRVAGLRIPGHAEAEREIEAGRKLSARLIAACEPDFPRALAFLDPPPPSIWTRGDASVLQRPAVAVVGARVASAAGQRFARGLSSELGRTGYVVASGMARGIDAAAHEGALPSGTIAALGGGIDNIYPPEHQDLYRRIVEAGCVVVENEPGRTAVARDFPRRNRVIAGLPRGR